MKTERRHELQTNQLAHWLTEHLDQVRPYTQVILIGIVGLIAIALAANYLINSQASQSGAAWQSFFLAFEERSPEALLEVSKTSEGSSAGLWAKTAAGDVALARGVSALFSDRDEAKRELANAQKYFREVEAAAGGSPFLLARARYGLGQASESLGELDKAKAAYEKIVQAAPDSTLGKLAAERAKKLDNPDVEKWYAWFERQKPKRPQPTTPVGSAPKDQKGALDDLSPLPDLKLPSLEKELTGTQTPPSSEGKAEPPAETPPPDPKQKKRPTKKRPKKNRPNPSRLRKSRPRKNRPNRSRPRKSRPIHRRMPSLKNPSPLRKSPLRKNRPNRRPRVHDRAAQASFGLEPWPVGRGTGVSEASWLGDPVGC